MLKVSDNSTYCESDKILKEKDEKSFELQDILKNSNLEEAILAKEEEKPSEKIKIDIEQIEQMDSEIVRLKEKTEKLIQENNKLLSLNVDSLLSESVDFSLRKSDKDIDIDMNMDMDIDINSSHFDSTLFPISVKDSFNNNINGGGKLNSSKNTLYKSSSSVTINVPSESFSPEKISYGMDPPPITNVVSDELCYTHEVNIVKATSVEKEETDSFLIQQNITELNKEKEKEKEKVDVDVDVNVALNLSNNPQNTIKDNATETQKIAETKNNENEDLKINNDVNKEEELDYEDKLGKEEKEHDIAENESEEKNENKEIEEKEQESTMNYSRNDSNDRIENILQNTKDKNTNFNDKMFQLIKEKEHMEYRFKMEISQFQNQLAVANNAIKNYQEICTNLDEELGNEKRRYATDITKIHSELKNYQMEIDILKEKLNREEKENNFLIGEKNNLINNLTDKKDMYNDLQLTVEMIKSERDLLAEELSKIIPQFEELKGVKETFYEKQKKFEDSKLKSEKNLHHGLNQSLEYMKLLKDFKKQLEIKANLIDEVNPTGKIEVITESMKQLDENYLVQLRDMTNQINFLVDECNMLKQELESKDQAITQKDKSIQEEVEKNQQFQNTIDFLNKKISYYSSAMTSEDRLNKSLSLNKKSNCAAAKYIEFLENAFIENKKFSNDIILHYGLFENGGRNPEDSNTSYNASDENDSSESSHLQKIISDKNLEIQSLNQKLSALLREKELYGSSQSTSNNNVNDPNNNSNSNSNNTSSTQSANNSNATSTNSQENSSQKEELEALKEQYKKLKQALEAKTNLMMEFSDIEKNNPEESFVIYESNSHNLNEDNNNNDSNNTSNNNNTLSKSNSTSNSNLSIKKSASASSADAANVSNNREFTLDKEDFYHIKDIIVDIMDDKKERNEEIMTLNKGLESLVENLEANNSDTLTPTMTAQYLKEYLDELNRICRESKIYNFQFESFTSSSSGPEMVDKSTEFSKLATPKTSGSLHATTVITPITTPPAATTTAATITTAATTTTAATNTATTTTSINKNTVLLIDAITQTENDYIVIDKEKEKEKEVIEKENSFLVEAKNKLHKFYRLLNTVYKLLEGENKNSKIIRNACQKKMNKHKNVLSLSEKDSSKLMSELNKLLKVQKRIKDYINKHRKELENTLFPADSGLDLLFSSSSEMSSSLEFSSMNLDDKNSHSNSSNQSSNSKEMALNEHLKLLLRLDDIVKSLNDSNDIKAKLEERAEELLKLWKFEMEKYK